MCPALGIAANLQGGGRLSAPQVLALPNVAPCPCAAPRGSNTRGVQANTVSQCCALGRAGAGGTGQHGACRKHPWLSGERQCIQRGTEQCSVATGAYGSLLCPHGLYPCGVALNIPPSLTSESRGIHRAEDKPVTNLLLDGGAEELGSERRPEIFHLTGVWLLHSPVCRRLARTKDGPNLVHPVMKELINCPLP